MRRYRIVAVSVALFLGFHVPFAAPRRVCAQDDAGEARPRLPVSALMVPIDGATQAHATTLAIGARRGIEGDDRLRYVDPVDVMSDASVPEDIQAAMDDLDAIADLLRAGNAAAAQQRAAAAIHAFEMALVVVKRAALTDAYMLEAAAQCMLNRRRQCHEGFARVVTFRERAEYDESRYPPQYAQTFAQVRERVLAGPRVSVEIVTEPDGAEVFVDGRSFGPSPAVASDLLVGDHFVTIKRVGYEKLIARVTAVEGQRVTARFPLQRAQNALLLERDLERLPSELGRERAGPIITGVGSYLLANQIVFGLLRPSGSTRGALDLALFVYDLRTKFRLGESRATVPPTIEGATAVQEMVTELYRRVDLSGRVEAPEDPEGPGGSRGGAGASAPLYTRWWFWTAIGVVAASAVVVALTVDTTPDVPPGFTRFNTNVR
jgi:hypothetical protein